MTPKPVRSPLSASMPHQPHGPRGNVMPSTWPNSQTTTTTETKASATENSQPDLLDGAQQDDHGDEARDRKAEIGNADRHEGESGDRRQGPGRAPRRAGSRAQRHGSRPQQQHDTGAHDDQRRDEGKQAAVRARTGRRCRASTHRRRRRRPAGSRNVECAFEHGVDEAPMEHESPADRQSAKAAASPS